MNETGRSRGFGFVEMMLKVQTAIAELTAKSLVGLSY